MTQNKKSVLNPVGKAQAILVGETTMTMVLCDQSLVPVGTELYVKPSEGRLKLEIEVANDNALKWQNALGTQQARNKQLRVEVRQARELLRRCASFQLNPDLNGAIEQFLLQD